MCVSIQLLCNSDKVSRVICKCVVAMRQKSSSSQPPRFGTPDNRFYNMSYLACTAPSEYKRGPSTNPVPKDPMQRHFHRPGMCAKSLLPVYL